MYWIVELINNWNVIDEETKKLTITITVISITIMWLIIYSAVKTAIVNALKEKQEIQTNIANTIRIEKLERKIEEIEEENNK